MTVTQTQSSLTAQKRNASSLEPNHIAEGLSKRPRNIRDDSSSRRTPSLPLHLNIKPSGNFLFSSTTSIRARGLGLLHVLSDPLLLGIVSILEASDVLHLGSCSKALFAYCAHQPVWKDLFIRSSGGKIGGWAGTWRKTYLQQFEPTGRIASRKDDCMRPKFETPFIDCAGLFSDELYQPYLCANADVSRYFYPRSRKDGVVMGPRSTMACADARTMTVETFEREFGSPSEPVVVFHALTHLAWPAFLPVANDHGVASPSWSLANLRKRFPQTSFRAEALDCNLQTYCDYAENCSQDDAPLYLFDSRFVEKTAGDGDSSMGADYTPPAFFGEDLFTLMGDKRPDYRWLVGFLSLFASKVTKSLSPLSDCRT